MITAPLLPDQINLDDITAGNLSNAAKYNGELARRTYDLVRRVGVSYAAG